MERPYQVYALTWWRVDSGECNGSHLHCCYGVLSTGRVRVFTFPRATELFKQFDQRELIVELA